MIGDFFRRLLQILALSSVATVIYLNTLSVGSGSVVLLQSVSQIGDDNQGLEVLKPGIRFIPTLFVPGRWRLYRLDITPHVQEISIKLPLRYSAYLRLQDFFYVQLRLRVEGEVRAQEAIHALQAFRFSPTDRDKVVEENLQFLASEYFLSVNTNEAELEKLANTLKLYFVTANLPALQERLDKQLRSPWYKLTHIELKEISVPDSALYAAQIRNLDEVALADRRALLSQIEKESALALERKRNLEEISKAEKMAALIAENPYLLEYYKIEKLAPNAGKVVLGFPEKSEQNPQGRPPGSRGKNGNESKNEVGGEIIGAETKAR